MPDMRHCGMGWSNGPIAGGNGHILSLPASDLLMLGSEHWHYDEAVRAGKRVLFRGMARQGFRPAELGWNVKAYVDEITRDAVLVSEPITDFVGWNELNLQDERGDQRSDFGDLTNLYTLLGGFTYAALVELRKRPVTKNARLHFGAWAPKDETDYTDLWRRSAELADVIDVHAYGPGAGIVGHIDKYRALFPDKPIELTEWHSELNGPEMDRDTLAMLANEAAVYPDFRAYYFLWRWFNPPEHQRELASWIAVEGSPDRLALFNDPPVIGSGFPPSNEEPKPEPPPEPTPEPEPEMPDPWEHWSAADIARIAECPPAAVETNWPKIHAQLVLCEIADKDVQAAMIGTVAIESASTFAPVREAFWLGEDWRAENLRYYPYYGRGYIQLTWLENYARYGPLVAALWDTSPDQPDFDLVGTPDNALNPDIAAAVSALYFRDHGREDGDGIPEAARRHDWREVRRLVQGGDAGLDRLTQICSQLVGEDVPATTERYYGVDVPDNVIHQQNSWTCAVRSAYAALWTMDQQGLAEPVTYGDGGPRDVYEWMVPEYDAPNVGLLDHTGAGLVQMLRAHGYDASSIYPATLAQVLEEAGAKPVLLGGDTWNHWVYVRGRTNDGGLILENPSPGHAGISDYLRDSFERLGPMAMVWIEPIPVAPAQQPAADYPTLVGVAYHEDGVIVPALVGALAHQDWSQVDAALKFLRDNNPDRAA